MQNVKHKAIVVLEQLLYQLFIYNFIDIGRGIIKY